MKLQPLRFIKEFSVDHAEYRLSDHAGNSVVLHVDYEGNDFAVTEDKSVDRNFLDEVRGIARGLLARKHAVNLAEKEHYIINESIG